MRKRIHRYFATIAAAIFILLLLPFPVGASSPVQDGPPDATLILPSATGAANSLCAFFVTSNAASNVLASCSPDGTNWNSALRVGSHLSKTAPAATVFKGKLCVVYVVDNPSNDILVTCSPDGTTWPHDVRLGVQTKFAPAVAVFNDKLCVAYVANVTSNELFSTCSTDGVSWPVPTTVHAQLSKTPPALASFNGQLCLAFVANNPSNSLLITCSTDGVNYPANTGMGGELSRTGPSLVVSNNKLCAAWVADNDSYEVIMQCTSNAANWGGNYLVGGHASDQPPAFIKYNGQLCVAFKELRGIGLFITCSGDDVNFGSARRITNPVTTHMSKYAPSLVSFAANVDANALVDSGFRPNPEGYQFPNYGDVQSNDLIIDDLRQIFGDSAVCRSVQNGTCTAKAAATAWLVGWNDVMRHGHCYGMAVTAARFQRGMDFPAQFQANALAPYDLSKANIRRQIASYFVRQGARPAATALGNALTPTEVLSQFRSSFAFPMSDPLTLAIFDANRGHAITPYAVQDRGNGIFWISVYDNNWPGDTSRHVEINTAKNTWSYEFNKGDIWDDWMSVVPVTANNAPMACPFCADRSLFTNGTAQVVVDGETHSYVKDQEGHTVGYFDGKLRNEIPGAVIAPIVGGLGEAAPLVYDVPLTSTLTTVLSGEGIIHNDTTSVAQFGPDFAVTLDAIPVSAMTNDKITVATDGSAVKYESNEEKSVSIDMALNHTVPALGAAAVGGAPDFRFTVSDLPVSNSVSVLVEADGELVVYNANGGEGTYSVQVERIDEGGTMTFASNAISLAAGEVHYLNFVGWSNVVNGNPDATLTLGIDTNGDGKVDTTTDLTNQPEKLYLPNIAK